ncbi:MAG TPA: DUF480 domain-containing protein [Crenotrichaceae bacterium]|nr:DUF480 domain-containing protein [Crenotrichaceae bacterium]
MEEQKPKQLLTHVEARIIGCLMEKQHTTPGTYPLTFNALTNACNQKSNRDPVMKLSPGEVEHTVKELDLRGLVRIDYGDRANRVSQRMSTTYDLDKNKQALLSVLMLHYPQTLGDLRRRTERIIDWADNTEIELILLELMELDQPLVVLIPKAEGRREDRYAHTLCGEIDAKQLEMIKTSPSHHSSEIKSDRLEELELRVTALEMSMQKLLGSEPSE